LYHFYIISNPGKTVLYVGLTNSLKHRLIEHWLQRGNAKSFSGRYSCYFLIYFESFQYVQDAILREKQVKKWRRSKKLALVKRLNPDLNPLNEQLFGEWPPKDIEKYKRKIP